MAAFPVLTTYAAHELRELLDRTDQAHAWDEIGRRALDHDPLIQIVEDEGLVIAAAIVTLYERESQRHAGWLRTVTHPDYRSGGHGGKALRAVIRVAKEQGLRRLVATPFAENFGAREFFEKHGFGLEGYQRWGYRGRDGVLQDLATYSRTL